MPNSTPPPEIPYVNLESEPIKYDWQKIQNDYALSLVKTTFATYETFRSNNHDRRWQAHDSLFFGFVPQRMWPGSTIPRSSLGVPIVFDQVEAALPPIMEALFGGDEWCEAIAEQGTDPAEARQTHAALMYDFDHGKGAIQSSCEPEIELAVKQVLLYGQGGVLIKYNPATRAAVPEWIDLRNVYFDPACPTPSIDDMRAVIHKIDMTVEEIASYRGQPGMNIPSDEVLYYLAKSRPGVFGDNSKRAQEALRGVTYSPTPDQWLPNPAAQMIEVLCYYSAGRIIWTLNRTYVAYNEINPYGFIPLAFAPCYSVPGRFYAMGIADVQDGNQRYIEALFNARLDELALILHPPKAVKRGMLLTPAQQRWGVGQSIQVDNPREDIMPFTPPNATANVMGEIQYIEIASEKRTGINGVGQGVPRGGNVNRTATGVQSQQNASASRIRTIVKAIEDYMLTPMLYKMLAIKQLYADPDQMYPANSVPGQPIQMVAGNIIRKPARFKLLCSSKLMTKMKLQEIAPMLLQNLTTGPLVAALAQTGQTVDFNELINLVIDSTGIRKRYNLVRPMTPEEQQKVQQEQQMQMQQSQQQIQAQQQMAERKNEVELEKARIAKEPSEGEAMMLQLKMQLEQQQAAMEAAMKEQELEFQRQIAQLKLFAERQKAVLAAEKQQADIDAAAQRNYFDLQARRAETEMSFAERQQSAEFDRQERQETQSFARADASDKLEFAKKQRALQLRAAGDKKPEKPRKKAAAPKQRNEPKPV